VAETLHDVEDSCTTAVDILNDILLYDTIEDGRMELDKGDISALALITKCQVRSKCKRNRWESHSLKPFNA
jgi:hypothetical protein